MNCCHDCRYYIIRSARSAQKTGVSGHCIMPRVKIRRADAPACLRFVQRESNLSEFEKSKEPGP